MNTILSFQHTVCIIAVDFDLRTFYTCHITILAIELADFETIFFAPHDVHAQEHIRPIAAFRATGTGIDFEYAGELVFRLIECAAELNVINDFYCSFVRCIELLFGGFPCIEKFQQDAEVIDDSFNGFKIGDPVLICFDLLQRDLRSFCLCPEIRIERELLVFC
jgi:hypothetical protein